MTSSLTITKHVRFGVRERGRRVLEESAAVENPDPGLVPRVSRLMALAIHMEDLIRRGEVADYSELARLAHVSRARITQIMNLLHLAPDIQEEILYLPRSNGNRASIRERMMRPIASIPDWGRQKSSWRELKGVVQT